MNREVNLRDLVLEAVSALEGELACANGFVSCLSEWNVSAFLLLYSGEGGRKDDAP